MRSCFILALVLQIGLIALPSVSGAQGACDPNVQQCR